MNAKAKVNIIYMAAGNSRRFGSNKLMTEYHGKPLVRYGLDAIFPLTNEYDNVGLTIVSQHPEVLEYINRGPEVEDTTFIRNEMGGISPDRKFQSVFSPESKNGAAFTIEVGIRESDEAYGGADYYMFLVADQPGITTDTLRCMIEALPTKEPVITAAFHGQPCNPCMFHASLLWELLDLRGDQGGRIVANRHPNFQVEVGSADEVWDIDFPEDMLIK